MGNTMIHRTKFVVGAFVMLLTLASFHEARSQEASQGRQRFLMDFNWKFQLGDQKGAEAASYYDNKWRTLDLPHDWSIEGEYTKDAPTGGSGGYLPTGIGWYRKHFRVPAMSVSREVWIEFDVWTAPLD